MRVAAVILFCISSSFSRYQPADPAAPPRIPHLTISLPADVASDKIAVTYYMTGAFGGYGDTWRNTPNLQTVDIEAGINGTVAKNIKAVAYAPGCAFAVFEFDVADADIKSDFLCKPLATLPFVGRITPASILQGKNVEVEVVYLSTFSDQLFHVMDGFVTIFPVAKIRPDSSGNFIVALPDLLQDPLATKYAFHDSSFRFVLREVGTMNIVSFMKQKDDKKSPDSVRLASGYPKTVTFIANEEN